MTMDFVFQRPARHFTKTRRLGAKARSAGAIRGDIDNHVKFVLDSLQNIFFKNDKTVTVITARKRYTRMNEHTHTAITVTYLGNTIQ